MTLAAKPVTLRSWSIITDLNGLGEAVCTFVIGNPGVGDNVLIVSMNPRAVEIVRVAMLDEKGDWSNVRAASLPYIVRDMSETLTRQHFPQLSQPLAKR